VGALIASLEDAAGRVAGWPLEDCDEATLCAGEKRAYRAGRRALAAVAEDPSDEQLHEWRKRVKDLWYHQRLLANAWTGPMKAQADECDTLGALLGDDHDLATLAENLPSSAPPSVDVDALLGLIAVRRGELQAQARALGRLVYAEKPKAHARRIGGYLSAADPAPAV
jgi:CHAD domain-containing protein